MAINDFDFPGVTLQQVFEGTVTGTVGRLSVACVGPQYRLHRADNTAEAALITQTETSKYSPETGLTIQEIPGISKFGEIDEDKTTQRLVVKDGVFVIVTCSGTTSDEGTDATYAVTFDETIADGLGKYAAAKFGVRGIRVGDPVVLTFDREGTNEVVETFIIGFASVNSANGYDKVLFDYADLPAGAEVEVAFGVRSDAVFTAESGAVIITKNAESQSVQVSSNIKTNIPEVGLECTLQSGTLYVEYREFVQDFVGRIGSVASDKDVSAVLGEAHPDNPLAMAVYAAAKAANGVIVYFTGVATQDVTGYEAAIGYLENYSNIYSIVPATDDKNVITAALAAVEASENEESKIRRSLWYGVDSPAEVELMHASSTFKVTTSGNSQVLTFPRNLFLGLAAKEGDVLEIGGDTYSVIDIRSQAVAIKLTDNPVVESADKVNIRVVRKYPQADDIVDAVIAAKTVSSYRAQCVWSEGAYINGYKVQNYVLAAAAAGMRSYEEVQRPLSNLGYNFITVEETLGFTKNQLLKIGSNGIWIIGNNNDGIAINRKQVTTAASGNLNKDEESIVANADEIALSVVNVGADLVGCSNISDSMLSALRGTLSDIMDKKLTNATSLYVGPQLLAWNLLGMWQDEVHKDWVWVEFECEPPKPFNKFKMVMRVI